MVNRESAFARRSTEYQPVILQWNILHRILIQHKLEAADLRRQIFGGSYQGLPALDCNSLCQHSSTAHRPVCVLRLWRLKDKGIGLIQAKADAVSGAQRRIFHALAVDEGSVGGTIL